MSDMGQTKSALKLIEESGERGCSAAEILLATGMPRPSVTRTLYNLVERGLAVKVPHMRESSSGQWLCAWVAPQWAPAQPTDDISDAKKRLLALIRDDGPVSCAQIARSLGKNEETIRSQLKDLLYRRLVSATIPESARQPKLWSIASSPATPSSDPEPGPGPGVSARTFWDDLRARVVAFVRAQGTDPPNADFHLALRDLETDLKQSTEQFAKRLARLRKQVVEPVSRRRLVDACHVLALTPPAVGVAVDANKARRAKREAVRLYHPDMNQSNESTRAHFEQVIEAFDLIEQYNAFINQDQGAS